MVKNCTTEENDFFTAIDLMKEKGLYKQAIHFYWVILRDRLFSWLYSRNIDFSSTENAVFLALKNIKDNSNKAELYKTYMIGILANWDSNFSLTSEEFYISEKCFLNQLLIFTKK